jgi:hypothetical protein
LTSITIPDSVTSMLELAFADCSSLTSVTIPNSVTNIGSGSFSACGGLSAITVNTDNSVYSSVDGVLFNKSQTTLIQYPAGKAGTAYTVPPSVTSIGDSAFDSCTSLTSITIPDSVTNIGDLAFYNCTGLTGVCFQGNAPSVGSDVFSLANYGTDNATVYYLPGSTGWDTTFGGRPTALWNPLIQASGPSSGVQTNQFGFTITGTTNIPILVEACTDLASASWTTLQTCTLTNGSVYFSDPAWTNYPARFYRLREP